jgi:phage baseplate assembly protein W
MANNTFFSDLPLSLTVNPITGDISTARNESAVKKSLINLLKTPVGTKPFLLDYGTRLQDYLFEPADIETELAINDEIAETIKKFEPRVELVAIESSIQDSGIQIRVDYYVVNVSEPQSLELIIKRVK